MQANRKLVTKSDVVNRLAAAAKHKKINFDKLNKSFLRPLCTTLNVKIDDLQKCKACGIPDENSINKEFRKRLVEVVAK